MLWIRESVITVIVGLASALLAGCFSPKSHPLSSVDESLLINGTLTTETGTALAGATVRAEREAVILATSDAKGMFSLRLSRNDVRRLMGTMPVERKNFYLYFEHAELKLFSASASISTAAIGDKALGVVVVAPPASYGGRVLRADQGRMLSPAVGSKVQVGPVEINTDNDGNFSLAAVPNGRIPVTVISAGLETYSTEAELQARQTFTLDRPLLLFPGRGPDGILVAQAEPSQAQLKTTGQPRARRFRVMGSSQARFVRFHHDVKAFSMLQQPLASPSPTLALADNPKAGSEAPLKIDPILVSQLSWTPLGEFIDYDFPQAGMQKLYYQFADATKTRISPVLATELDVNVFRDTKKGFADSEEKYISSTVPVVLEVPTAALTMRMAEDTRDLQMQPWQPVKSTFSYAFRPRDATPARGGEPLKRDLYVQFRDSGENISVVYHRDFFINLFDNFKVKVADGSNVVNAQIVPVQLTFGADVPFIRMAGTSDEVSVAVWNRSEPVPLFRFRPELDSSTNLFVVSGSRRVCVQLKDANGFISAVICQDVEVDLFPMASPTAFTINGGAPIATSLVVELDIRVPANAKEMRIYERSTADSEGIIAGVNGTVIATSVGDQLDRIWVPAVPRTFFTFRVRGSKNLHLQFRDPSGLASTTFEQFVTILPMVEAYAATDMLINGGAVQTFDPTLNITIVNVPQTASAMTVWVDDQLVPFERRIWMPVTPLTFANVVRVGRKTIYLQFRNNDLQLSPVIAKLIDYDPFPTPLVNMIIAGGAATTTVRDVPIQIVAPPLTTAMRIAMSSAALFIESFQPFESNFVYRLPSTTGQNRLYYQLRSINGDESLVFNSPVINYDQVPNNLLAITVNTGAPSTTSNVVNLAITAPAAATLLRVASDPVSLSLAPYQVFQSNLNLTLPAATGTYKVYAQVKTADDNQSNVFNSAPFTYDPLPLTSLAAVINGGATNGTDPNVTLQITAPLTATAMRVGNSAAAAAAAAYQPYAPTAPYALPNLDGTYTIFVQLKTAAGNESQIFSTTPAFILDVP